MLRTVPIELKAANEFVAGLHRHHDPVYRDKYRLAAEKDGKIVGVIQVGRPVARHLDDGMTLEVVRLCTNGTKNVCSFLCSRAARIAAEMGYRRIVTYILDTEMGASLKAAGWHKEADTRGHTWSCPSRPRADKAPVCDKQRWSKSLIARKMR